MEVVAFARMGAADDYEERNLNLLEAGVRLIHAPEEYASTIFLPYWYPLIEEFTPKSVVYDEFP